MDSLAQDNLRECADGMVSHSAFFHASGGACLGQDYARKVVCKRQRDFRERKLARINSRPARAHIDATRGPGNAPCRTIACSACNTDRRFGRTVHPDAKFPGKVALWALRLFRSWQPPRRRERYHLEESVSWLVPPRQLCSRRYSQYTPARRPSRPYFALCLLQRE
jgi:hypothetical protein